METLNNNHNGNGAHNIRPALPSHPAWPTFPSTLLKYPRNDSFLFPSFSSSNTYPSYYVPQQKHSSPLGSLVSSISNRWNGWVHNWAG